MAPLNEYELGRILGDIQARVTSISEMIETWEHRCRMCSERVESRLKKCEDSQLKITTVAATVGFLAGIISSWVKDLFLGGK